MIRDPAFFELVPEVLPDWVEYAGSRRGVPAKALGEAVEAVAVYRDRMLDITADPDAWGPAKAFAVAAQRAGVDLSDAGALEAFIEQHNDQLRPG